MSFVNVTDAGSTPKSAAANTYGPRFATVPSRAGYWALIAAGSRRIVTSEQAKRVTVIAPSGSNVLYGLEDWAPRGPRQGFRSYRKNTCQSRAEGRMDGFTLNVRRVATS